MKGRRMIARYDGRCADCGDEIVADLDEIVMTDDGAMHEDCASSEPEPITFVDPKAGRR